MHSTLELIAWLRGDRWLGNTPLSWFIAAGGAIVGFVAVRAAVGWTRHRLERRAQRTGRVATRSVAAALAALRTWLLVLLAIVIPLSLLSFGGSGGGGGGSGGGGGGSGGGSGSYWLHLATFVLVGMQLVLCVNRVIITWLMRSVEPGAEVPVMLGILTWGCQFVVWITFLLAVLTNAGVNITAFVASLGIGGIAVALALQNILGDLFASVAIGLDKPFEPGEFISFGTELGTVKHVGVKTTRIASLSGEQLAISNSQLLNQLTHNFSRMPERRVVFDFAVPYETPKEQLREITRGTRQIIEDAGPVRFDRGHFTGFDERGFTFEFVYYVLDSDFTLYRDIQQDVNEQLMDLLDSIGVRFAVPGRAVAVRDPSHDTVREPART